MSASATPNDIAIERRNPSFARDGAPQRWWHGGDPGKTAFFNALSATFPLGERFFMDAVRRYRDRTAEPLRGQIGDFLYQEAAHTREHVLFNQQAAQAGYDLAALEARTARLIGFARSRKPLVQLAATCALEHFTATLAEAALADPTHFEGAPPEIAKLWHWHAVEEIEHKAVAYDTFLVAAAALSPFRRWVLRSLIMIMTCLRFQWVIGLHARDLLRQDERNDAITWLKLLGFAYVSPGPMRKLSIGALKYCAPGFHPWRQDDRALLAEARAAL